MFFCNNLNRMSFFKVVIFAIVLVFISQDLLSQSIYKRKNNTDTVAKVFPDKYSDLDDNKAITKDKSKFKDDEFNNTLENSKQKYFQALILIQKGDTSGAAKFFEESLDKLNKLSSYPGIEKNHEFMDLAQSIIDDYETFVKNTHYIDENSSVFIVKELLFKEVESIKGPQTKELPKIVITPDKAKNTKKNLIKNRIFIPDTFKIDLADKPDVLKNISFLTTRGRKVFAKWLERSTRWFPMLYRMAFQEKMPLEIMFLAMIESGLNPNAVSKANAVGMWQFIRTTGEMYDLNAKSSYWIDERRDPEKATLAAMRHLKDLYNELGDWHLALAAYNCGVGGVTRAIKKSKKENPDYWTVRPLLPKETSNYVPAFIAAAKVACDPESYGFNLDSLNFMEEYKYDILEVKGGAVNLEAIAKSANSTIEQIKDLNPELLKSSTPPDYEKYYVKIPYGTADVTKINFSKLTLEEKDPFIKHSIRAKESIPSIAKLYKVPKEELLVVNRMTNPKAKLEEDSTIIIPLSHSEFDRMKIDLSKPIFVDNREEDIAPKKSKKITKNEKIENKTHIVLAGETLFSIAKNYNTDVALIRKFNNLTYNSDNISVGQELIIAKNSSSDVNSDEDSDDDSNSDNKNTITKNIKHKVKKGETLYQIADKYDVSKSDIIAWNKLKKGRITKGQILKIQIIEELTPKVTKKSKAKTSEDIAQNTEDFKSSKLTIHKVKKGESLTSIASKYKVSESDLKKWNEDVIKGSSVYYNTKLKIYPPGKEPKLANEKSKKSDKKNKKNEKYYKIQDGDTLSAIARKFNLTLTELKSKNKNLDENKLKIGQQIRVD